MTKIRPLQLQIRRYIAKILNVEENETGRIFEAPEHEYAHSLVSAVYPGIALG